MGQTLLHSVTFMSDKTAETAMSFPCFCCQDQVAASHVLLVALFGRLGCLHTLSDRGTICHNTRVEISYRTNQCGLVSLELFRGRWKQGD